MSYLDITSDLINDIFLSKEKCAVCKQEFNSILLEHPKFDAEHKAYGENRKKERQIIEANRKPWNKLNDPINRFISKECPNLESAKAFAKKWAQGTHEFSIDKQEIKIPDTDFTYGGTMRSMAYTISRVLEGYDDNTINIFMTANYLTTVYGPELYQEM